MQRKTIEYWVLAWNSGWGQRKSGEGWSARAFDGYTRGPLMYCICGLRVGLGESNKRCVRTTVDRTASPITRERCLWGLLRRVPRPLVTELCWVPLPLSHPSELAGPRLSKPLNHTYHLTLLRKLAEFLLPGVR